MNTEVMVRSKSEMWAIPQDFFDRLNKEFPIAITKARFK